MPSRKIPWTSQPQSPVAIDKKWLDLGLSYVLVNGVEMVTGKRSGLKQVGVTKYGRSEIGISWYKSTADVVDYTIIAHHKYTSNNADWSSLQWGFYVSGVDNVSVGIGLSGAADQIYAVNRKNSSVAVTLESITFPYEAVWAQFGSHGSTSTIYKNGLPFTTVAHDGAAFATDTRRSFDKATSTATGKEYAFAYKFDRILSPTLIKELSIDPWQIFAPKERNTFVSVAGGATIIDLTAAALNFTPQSTQNVLTASLTAGASSFTPQDTQNALAAPLSAGALSFTPQGTQNTSVTTLSVGALNFTPQDITAQNGTAPVIVSLDAGTFSFTPQGIQSLNTLNLANATFSNTALDLQILLTANLTAYALNATPQPPQMTTINNLTSSTFNFTPYPIGATGAVTADAGASKMLMGVGY